LDAVDIACDTAILLNLLIFDTKLMQGLLWQYVTVQPEHKAAILTCLNRMLGCMPRLFQIVKNSSLMSDAVSIRQVGELNIHYLQFIRFLAESQNQHFQLFIGQEKVL